MFMILIRWLITTLAVWVAVELVPGIDYDRWQTLALAALVLGILNTFVKPLLTLVSISLVIFTFGLFIVVINAALLMFTAWLVPGFHVTGWPAAFAGSIIISVIACVFRINSPRRDGWSSHYE